MRSSLRRLALAAVALAAVPSISPAQTGPARAVSVAVAANLKPAFEEIAAAFRAAHPGVEVRTTYGASGNFFSQIANGAPFDLFLSADADYPAKLVEKGLSDGKAFTYAYGKLAVWVPSGSPIDLDRRGLAALTDPSVKKIAMPNPQLAPYGRAARAALEKAGLHERVKDRIVLGQNVSHAAQFVQSGNAQAGFVPLSLAKAPPLSAEGRAWLVPPSSHPRIEQAGVVVQRARQRALARELATFLSGDAARAVLAEHGYDLPGR